MIWINVYVPYDVCKERNSSRELLLFALGCSFLGCLNCLFFDSLHDVYNLATAVCACGEASVVAEVWSAGFTVYDDRHALEGMVGAAVPRV